MLRGTNANGTTAPRNRNSGVHRCGLGSVETGHVIHGGLLEGFRGRPDIQQQPWNASTLSAGNIEILETLAYYGHILHFRPDVV